jgi:hypothetical protein
MSLGRQLRCLSTQQAPTDESPHQCTRALGHEGDHEFDVVMILNGPILWLPGPALCTTSGKPVAEVLAGQRNETGQHEGYIVLCPDERAKGFVRPYRDKYKHVGPAILEHRAGCPSLVCVCRHAVHENNRCGSCECGVFAPSGLCSCRRSRACGTVTTMGRALSETYARDPKFYGATFCCGCNRHLPVAEFVWTADGQEVGS